MCNEQKPKLVINYRDRQFWRAVNATRVPKKAKPSSSPDVTSPQKVEGLRTRVKKSSIELAVELRAKRDTPVSFVFYLCTEVM